MEIFRNLIAWQKAHQLVIEIYKLVKTYPEKKIYFNSANFTSYDFRRSKILYYPFRRFRLYFQR